MANKVFNMAGGQHSPAALSAYIDEMFGDSIAKGLNVIPTGSSGLAVTVKAGTGNISTGQQYGRLIQADADQNVTLSAASPTYARIDTIIAWIDNSVTPTTAVTDNTNGILNFSSVSGTPAATPQASTDAQIQSAIGSGNPFQRLATVTVAANATSIIAANITDARNLIFPLKSAMIGEKQVKSHNIDWATYSVAKSGTHSVVNDTTFRNVNFGGGIGTLSITIDVPSSGKVKVGFGGHFNNGNAGEGVFFQLNVTGANTFATDRSSDSTDPRGITLGQPGQFGSMHATKQFVGLNPGPTTFTLQVRSGGGTSVTKAVTSAALWADEF